MASDFTNYSVMDSQQEKEMLLADPRSKKARQKHSEALGVVCANHYTTLDKSNVMVCEGRKIVHVLNVGVIDSPLCFRKEVPTASYRIKGPDGKTKMKDSAWNSIVIPNGWKVAVVVGNDPWTAEVRITTKVEFRFVRVNRDGQEVIDTRSIWCETPGAAFKSLFSATLS